MSKRMIKVIQNLNKNLETFTNSAIVANNVIKYIDFVNNKFVLDLKCDLLIKENNEYKITINFKMNEITILLKANKQEFVKMIETLSINKSDLLYKVKYKLIDEDIINEYQIEIL